MAGENAEWLVILENHSGWWAKTLMSSPATDTFDQLKESLLNKSIHFLTVVYIYLFPGRERL